MAFSHIHYNGNSQYGSKLRDLCLSLEQSLDKFADVRALILGMIDGDGSNIAHFDEVVKRFEFLDYASGGGVTDPQRTAARNAWLELDSAYSKVSGDGSVTLVNAALNQFFNKLRN